MTIRRVLEMTDRILSPGKVVPDYCGVAKVCMCQEGYFLIRSGCRDVKIHKPAVAVGVFIDNRGDIAVEDDVSAVEHRHHLCFRQCLRYFLYGRSTFHCSIYIPDFLCYISVDEVLISLELDRAVASDTLVVIALDGVVESVYTEVEDTEVRICILMDYLVHRTWFVVGGEILRSNEMALVEVSLSDSRKVEEYKQYHGHCCYCQSSFEYERTVLSRSVGLRSPERPYKQSEDA